VLEWVEQNGGVVAMERAATQKASRIYDAIDESGGFYTCRIDPAVRSSMNVVFRLPSEDLEKAFVKQTESEGMIGLKGHRSVGGCRASLYNALPLSWASALADFMGEFARING
jgi:phosphoserine aminotransferase